MNSDSLFFEKMGILQKISEQKEGCQEEEVHIPRPDAHHLYFDSLDQVEGHIAGLSLHFVVAQKDMQQA
jgi:hypothetical protein